MQSYTTNNSYLTLQYVWFPVKMLQESQARILTGTHKKPSAFSTDLRITRIVHSDVEAELF